MWLLIIIHSSMASEKELNYEFQLSIDMRVNFTIMRDPLESI